MNFEEKLTQLSDYNIGFEIKMGYYHVYLTYKKSWDILQPDNEEILVKEQGNVCHYVADQKKVKAVDIFNSIDETIKYNEDVEKRVQLFRNAVDELKKLFADEDYDTLKTLRFNVKRKKKKQCAKTKDTPNEKKEVKEEQSELDKAVETQMVCDTEPVIVNNGIEAEA